MNSKFIDQNINGYIIEEWKADGQYGKVYRAVRKEIDDTRAIKFIPVSKLREGWENEIIKVRQLARMTGVVQYQAHEKIKIGDQDYIYIMWEYIPGKSLREIIQENKLTIPILKRSVIRTLEVLNACKVKNIQHGDLHTGNILIEDPNPIKIDPTIHDVWITDFGYGKASIGSEILDDYKGLYRIIQDGIKSIDFHYLDADDKRTYSVLKHNFPKFLLETDYTEGDYVRDPRSLINKLNELITDEKKPISTNGKSINDYLAAELLVDKFDEWKDLFVPSFLGESELLVKNPVLLTGLRGCGKTMIFRRLTALYDCHLGPSGVSGADDFLGFYLNARNIAEAFPWLPKSKMKDARTQVIHYFHICWILEVIEWFKEIAKKDKTIKFNWFIIFLNKYFPDLINTSDENFLLLNHIHSFIIQKLDESRLKSKYKKIDWPLSDLHFLDNFFSTISKNLHFIKDKIFFLFLDDYSTPMVTDTTQEILNPIIFRRSSKLIFKVATESVESFNMIGLNGKILEEKDDYILVDFAAESILRDSAHKQEILSNILKRRIDRNRYLKTNKLNLKNILGKTDNSYIDLAYKIRGTDHSKIQYYGYETFCDLWSSNTRRMISIFAEMISSTNIDKVDLQKDKKLVKNKIQDRILRNEGGSFLSLLTHATPLYFGNYRSDDHSEHYRQNYGEHLVNIAKSFHQMALHELRTKNSKNVNSDPPKQSRRIEIKNILDFNNPDIEGYYRGIIRYGLFIRDNRGKSVRGKAVPRLYLSGLLIPFFTLTFSKRDNIKMSWEQFCKFLKEPLEFSEKFIKGNNLKNHRKKTIDNNINNQLEMDV